MPSAAAAGTADAHLAVPFAMTLGGATWYGALPLVMGGVVAFKPAAPGDELVLASPVQLVDSLHRPMGTIASATFTPRPELAATVALTLNRSRFLRNETLLASLLTVNPGPAFDADLLLSISYPDGRTLVVTNAAPLGAFLTASDDARMLMPLVAGVQYAAGHSSSAPDLLACRFAGSEPAGGYAVRVALVVPGSLHDGRLDPPDVIAQDEARFVYSGASPVRRLLRARR